LIKNFYKTENKMNARGLVPLPLMFAGVPTTTGRCAKNVNATPAFQVAASQGYEVLCAYRLWNTGPQVLLTDDSDNGWPFSGGSRANVRHKTDCEFCAAPKAGQ